MKCRCGDEMSIVDSRESTLSRFDHPEMQTTRRRHKCSSCGSVSRTYQIDTDDLLSIIDSERKLNTLRSILLKSIDGE